MAYTYCDQAFFVQDEEGNPIFKARVDFGGSIYYSTNTVGYCWARDLQEGEAYTATAQKPGTHSGNPSRTFIACRNVIVFTLTKKACDQEFKVEDENGNPVAGAKIDLGGTIYYTTDSFGKCTIRDLWRNDSYTATVKKSGFSKDTRTFTACTSLITLTISELYCNQEFKVEDENGDPLEGARVDLGHTIYYTTDSSGKCTIRDLLIDDTYTATARRSGYIGKPSRTFTACRSEILFSLTKGAALTFRVQTPERVALPNATVKIQQEGDPYLTCKTDKYGECEITVPIPFEGTAITSHWSYRDSYPLKLTIDNYESQYFFIRVLPAICTQIFIVAAEDETLLTGAKVTMRTEEGAYIDSATTDTNGECTISFTALYFEAEACCQGYECHTYDTIFQCDPGSSIHFFLTPKPPEAAGAQLIVQKNAEAMAEAMVSRYDGITLPGFSDPPYLCPLCGESFNTTLSFINHVGMHITAYEALKKQWL